MKKILLLGGSMQQIIAIKTAERLGYYTILCDFLPDNPGQYHADKYYSVSTTDKEKILLIAKEEQVQGVIAYASDPAAPTAAYVAEKLGLPGNPCRSVEILCDKNLFRTFLRDNGFNAPRSQGYSSLEEALIRTKKINLPVIVKPADSSGSKGVTVLRDLNGYKKALQSAFSFSRSHRVIVEDYIEKDHPYLIGGDVFVIKGRIVIWGLMNCHRDSRVNSLVPAGKSYPLLLSERNIIRIKTVLQSIVDKLEIKNGGMNVEMVIDKSGRIWPVDIGPRCGGNMIPDLLGMIFDTDIIEMSVKAVMSEDISYAPSSEENRSCFATYNLHSDRTGILEKIEFSVELEKYIIRKEIYIKEGDKVEYFDNASKALGIVFPKFESREKMFLILENINKYIKVRVR